MFDQITLDHWNAANAGMEMLDSPPSDWQGKGAYRNGVSPLFVVECDTHIRLWFALPPLRPGSLKLDIHGSTIWMRGMAFRPETGPGEVIAVGNTLDSRTAWTLRLPFDVKSGEVEAIHSNGMLEIVIATAAEEQTSAKVSLKAA